eukprot:11831697-Prorocentrum_lima.AAC.1
MARYDLLRVVAYLATTVAKWTLSYDQHLHRLVAYITSTLTLRQVSWSGDPASALTLTLYADADFAASVPPEALL